MLLVGFGLELNQSSEFPTGFMGVKKFELNDGQYFEDGCCGGWNAASFFGTFWLSPLVNCRIQPRVLLKQAGKEGVLVTTGREITVGFSLSQQKASRRVI